MGAIHVLTLALALTGQARSWDEVMTPLPSTSPRPQPVEPDVTNEGPFRVQTVSVVPSIQTPAVASDPPRQGPYRVQAVPIAPPRETPAAVLPSRFFRFTFGSMTSFLGGSGTAEDPYQITTRPESELGMLAQRYGTFLEIPLRSGTRTGEWALRMDQFAVQYIPTLSPGASPAPLPIPVATSTAITAPQPVPVASPSPWMSVPVPVASPTLLGPPTSFLPASSLRVCPPGGCR